MKNYNLKFKILPHTADLKMQVYGKAKEELFLNMLFGMAESQRAEIKNKEKIKREIKINSPDLGALLVDFLSEVLYLSQVNKEIYKDIKFKKLTSRELEGELIGQKFERIGLDIKAVTYYSLDIHQKKDRTWEATVLFDV